MAQQPRTLWTARDTLATLTLFGVTATVVLWQVHRVGILWDLSYILDSAYRISLGQMPYRDLPFAHAPLTFLMQAAIMRLTGRVFFHHALYAAAAAGFGTVLTWRIILRTLKTVPQRLKPRSGAVRVGTAEAVPLSTTSVPTKTAWLMALLLASAGAVLSVYSILPIPFYDCDCALSIMVALYLLQRVTAASSATKAFIAGAALIPPVFFKQNIGLPFLLAALTGIAALAALRRFRPADDESQPRPNTLLQVLVGALGTLVAAALLLQLTAGMHNYYRWTVQFAAQRRMPGLHDMLAVYAEPSLRWTLPAVLCAVFLLNIPKSRHLDRSAAERRDPCISFLADAAPWLAFALLSAPFFYTLLSLHRSIDPDDRAASLLALWPLLLVLSGAHTLYALCRSPSLRALLPVLALAAIHGTLLSQQLWGSTYALWPLFLLLLANLLAALPNTLPKLPKTALAGVIAVTLIACGLPYIASEERLSYSKVLEGPITRSTLPELAGLSVHGPYLPAFDQLVRFTTREIPQDDGILLLNGEDPFFFATGRTPRFPILLFDPATDPYSPAQTVAEARAHGIRWLIVKRDLQIKADPSPNRDQTLELLREDFAPYRQLDNYDIYRRPPAIAPAP